MELQNRVAPDGSLHAVAARGTLTGNRGILHDPTTRKLTGRRWTTKAWIACRLEWKNVRRAVWGRQIGGKRPGWSELFFLDEVTALAAGHRPCFFCRRPEAANFLACACRGLGVAHMRAPDVDTRLHGERLASTTSAPRRVALTQLLKHPDATMFAADGDFFALRRGVALPWSHRSFGAPVAIDSLAGRALVLVTPPTVVAAYAAGYRPAWHVSAA